jgi:hypothetical protein
MVSDLIDYLLRNLDYLMIFLRRMELEQDMS